MAIPYESAPGGGAKPEKVGRSTYNATTGQTTNPAKFGQFQTNDLAFLLQSAAKNPDMAAAILRLARGQTGRGIGRFAGARDNLYGRAFQTALALGGAPGFGSLEDMANDFLSEGVLGNDLLGYGSGLGQQIAGMDFTGMESADMEELLSAGLALQGLNMGGIGAGVRQGQLQDVLWEDLVRNLADPNNDQRNFADLLANSPYRRAMASFGR